MLPTPVPSPKPSPKPTPKPTPSPSEQTSFAVYLEFLLLLFILLIFLGQVSPFLLPFLYFWHIPTVSLSSSPCLAMYLKQNPHLLDSVSFIRDTQLHGHIQEALAHAPNFPNGGLNGLKASVKEFWPFHGSYFDVLTLFLSPFSTSLANEFS